MRIAVTVDPFIPVPPLNYGGIERIADLLVKSLMERGHEVILVAHPDSKVECELIPYAPYTGRKIGELRNIIKVSSLLRRKIDVVHSFGRLAYLTLLLPSSIPKLMSYQREPTISLVKKAQMLAFKGSLAFTGCSNYIANKIEPYATSFTVYNGVSLDLYDFVETVSPQAPLAFLGRIDPEKGAHNAIAVALKTNNSLVIAGNIPQKPSAQNYFKKEIEPFLDGTQIKYIGPVNDVQKNELLGSAKAFLMPIEWNEPFGIVMAEALACGTPVLGYPRGAVPEIIEHGKNGFIAQNIEELAMAVNNVNVLRRDEARKSAEQRFSADVIVTQYLDVYKKLTNKEL